MRKRKGKEGKRQGPTLDLGDVVGGGQCGEVNSLEDLAVERLRFRRSKGEAEETEGVGKALSYPEKGREREELTRGPERRGRWGDGAY